MRAIERIDVATAIGSPRPSKGLHRARAFQREFVEFPLPRIVRNTPFRHQAKKIAIRADVVEAVIVNPGVGDVWRHQRNSTLSPDLEKLLFAGGVELQNSCAELETLCPFG